VLNVNFVYLGAVTAAVGETFYVVDTIRGKTQPNRVTWLLWAVAPLLAFAVEAADGVGLRSLTTFMVGFGPLVVFGASFVNRRAVWELGAFDYVCGALSVAGIAGWLVTRQGLVALVASIAADAIAGVPTFVKSWRQPETETATAYAGAAISAVLTLLTVKHVTAAVFAFPLYIAVMASLQVIVIGGRLGPRLRAMQAPA